MDNLHEAEKIIDSFENGTFLKVYGSTDIHTAPNNILQQLDDLILQLNSIFLPQFHFAFKNFSPEQKHEFLEKTIILKRIFTKLSRLENQCQVSNLLNIRCSKCNEVFTSVDQGVWDLIQQHEHFEENLLNINNTEYMCDPVDEVVKISSSSQIINRNVTNICDKCSCLVTIPTDFKFNFNIIYHTAVENMFYTFGDFKNEKVNWNGSDLYSLRIIDNNTCECLICFTNVSIKTYLQHTSGKKHLKQKVCLTSLKNLKAFHTNWVSQELSYQSHQIYFTPFSEELSICQLCDRCNIFYDSLENHILTDKHKKLVMNLFVVDPKLPYLKLQIKAYGEDVDKMLVVPNAQDSLIVPNIAKGDCVTNISLLQTTGKTRLSETSLVFNFKTAYHPTIEILVYNNNHVDHGGKIHNLNFIQYQNSDVAICLLCCCKVSPQLLINHLQEEKHLKKKENALRITDLLAYHKYWVSQNINYQAHQIYFYPCSPNSTSCHLCNNFSMFYELVHHHINHEKHKQHVLKFWEKYRLPLVELQQTLYQVEVQTESFDSVNNTQRALSEPSVIVNNHFKENEEVQTLVTYNNLDNKAIQARPDTNHCNNCSSTLRISSIRFNFDITYDPKIENLLYHNQQLVDKITVEDSILYAIQLKDVATCLCLLCCCEFSIKNIKSHVEGQKHMNKKSTDDCIKKLLTYHDYWISQEVNYQAHQIYFFPSTATSAECHLCDKLNIFYELVSEHIHEEYHKRFIMELNKNHSSPLINLQKEVYSVETIENSDLNQVINKLQEVTVNVPSTSGNFPTNRRFFQHNSDKSDSESEDDDSTIQNTRSPQSESKQKNVNKVIMLHNIVKSFDVNSNNELHTLIEHRFWDHFDIKAMKLCTNFVECLVCKVKLPKVHDPIFFHIISNSHMGSVGMKKKLYKYYCDICNIHMAQDDNWLQHLKHEHHKDRCQKIGASRQQKLAEYECKSCKLIIFGDDMSIKRHSITANQGKRKRTRHIVLNNKTKNLLISENILQESEQLVKEANEVLQNQERLLDCCNSIKETLRESYPKCAVYPFGSQVSGLGNWYSDLDLFVDLDDMYHGDKNQDSHYQVKFVANVMKLFGKKRDEFQNLNPIPGARTPIVQVFHAPTKLDCDLSFRHGLSVENTKFLRFCMQVQPIIQSLILILKEWLYFTKLSGRHITTYSLSMMVIFYFQISGYLTPVHELRQWIRSNLIIIDGWSVVDFDRIPVDQIKRQAKKCDKSLIDLLVNFFLYYGSFNYATNVVCPLLGRTITKSLFLNNPKGIDLPLEMSIYVKKVSLNTTEQFKAQSSMCIQDPFDLSHNLTKGCSSSVVEKYKKLCSLSAQLMLTKK